MKKWRNIPCSWFGRINIVKMSMLPRAVYTFKAIPIKIPSTYFRVGQKNSKICMEPEKTLNSQRNAEKENQIWWHHNSKLQVLLQSSHDQDSMVLAQKQTHGSVEQNRKPRNGFTTIWSKQQRISIGKVCLFNKWYWENWPAMCKKIKLDHFLTL